MDSPRPILPTELEFFDKGTGNGKHSSLRLAFIFHILTDFPVPLVVVFTKFDGQMITEYANLADQNIEDRWERARNNAEHTFQGVYLPRVLDTKYPPKAFVRLEGENG
jgi:hypothetical protein